MTVLIPEYHARDSKAPSRHFRPGYRPDQCGLRCTLSFSPGKRKKISENRRENKENRRKGVYQDAFWFYSLRRLISARCYKFIATLNHSWLRDGQGGRCGRAVRTLLVVPNHLFNHGLNFLFNFKILPPDPPYELLGFFYLFFIHQFEKNT